MYFTPGTAVEYLSCMHRRQCFIILPMLIPVCHNVSFMHSHTTVRVNRLSTTMYNKDHQLTEDSSQQWSVSIQAV